MSELKGNLAAVQTLKGGISVGGGGSKIELDTTLTQPGKAADAKAVGDALANISGISLVEPAEDDIPKVYWTGNLPTSKNEVDIQGTIRYKSKTADFQYPATLKVQGSSSVNYAKKNFTLKPYKDSTFESKKKLAFKNWPEMNKFVLKAHWIDHSHVRNVGTAKIWGKIVEARSDYAALPEELRNAPNNGATDGFSIKFFANGVYQGLYEWIVPKDKLFGQDSDIATHSILNSELNNQPTCAFATTSPTISGNWSEELQDSMSTAISTSFANLIKFVAGSTDEEFVANAENYFDVQSVIDFDIFARVFCIVDNLCRNQIFFTYDGAKWYEGVWDVDAILGLPPTVRGFFAYDTEFQTGYIAYKDYGVTNLLYQRVENLFLERFKARYAELRSGVLSVDSIIDVYERLTDTIKTYEGLLEEDYASTTGGGKFTGIPYTAENNIQQIRNFVAQRTAYMDEVIENMAGESGGGENPDVPDEPEQPDTPVTYGNLISVSDCGNAYINYNNGAYSTDVSGNILSTEKYIEVEPGVTYIADCSAVGITGIAQVGVRYYDANKVYTKEYFGADGIYCPKTFTVPTDKNIKYVRLQFVLNGAFKDSSYTGVSVSLFRADDALRCNGITFSESILNLDGFTSHTLNATVSPDGCLDRIIWSSSSPAVAKVSNGVVTSIENGDAVITATCGGYSATCSVSVSGIEMNVLRGLSLHDGYINYETGAVGTNTTAVYSDMGAISNLGTLMLHCENISADAGDNQRIAYYGEDDAFIKCDVSSDAVCVSTTPDNVSQFRVGSLKANLSEISVYTASDVTDFTSRVDGKYYNAENGQMVTEAAISCIKVPCVSGSLYYVTGCTSGCILDVNDAFVSGLVYDGSPLSKGHGRVFNTSHDGYICVNYVKTNEASVSVWQSSDRIGRSTIN